MKSNLRLAALMGFLGSALPGFLQSLPARLTEAQRERARTQAGYPSTGTGNRASARLARQQAKGMLNFYASNKCIKRINERRDAQVRRLLDVKEPA